MSRDCDKHSIRDNVGADLCALCLVSERDRYREALEAIMAYPDIEEHMGNILSAMAREALKSEEPTEGSSNPGR